MANRLAELADYLGEKYNSIAAQVPNNARAMYQGLLDAPNQLAQLASPQMAQRANQAMATPQAANKDQWIQQGMNLAGMAPVGGLIGATVYHGSPHSFDKFDMGKIGTGEGAQAYGHGLYMAESPAVARSYIDSNNAPTYIVNGVDVGTHTPTAYAAKLLSTTGTPPRQAVNNSRDLLSRINKLSPEKEQYFTDTIAEIDRLEKLAPKIEKGGTLYKVDIPDEAIPRMLDWDKPLSEQPAILKTVFDKKLQHSLYRVNGSKNAGDFTGAELVRALGEKRATQVLGENGVPGIRYLDGSSRNTSTFTITPPERTASGKWMVKGSDYNSQGQHFDTEAQAQAALKEAQGGATSNYVLFDDQMPRILEKNGQPTGLKPWSEDAIGLNGHPIDPHARVRKR